MCYLARVRAREDQQAESDAPLFTKGERTEMQLAEKDAQIAALTDRVKQLEAILECFKKQLFGSTSETYKQLGLQIEQAQEELLKAKEAEVTPETPQADSKKEEAKPRKKANVRIRETKVEVIRIVPDEVKQNPDEYEEIALDETHDVTNRIVYIPGHFVLHRYETPRFRQKGKWAGKHIVQAKAPVNTLGSSPVSESVIAHVIFNKYHQHQPLYRTLREFENSGLEGICESMLSHWMKVAAQRLEPIWMAIHDKLFDEPAIHIDETPVRCLPGGGKKEKTKQPPEDKEKTKKHGYMWTMCGASTGMVHYNWQWEEGRSQEALDQIMRRGKKKDAEVYNGSIITDGYTSYSSWLENRGEDRNPQQLCWTHIRRKFVDCITGNIDKKWCEQVVLQLAGLYKIEHELKEAKADAAKILETRTKKSKPIIDEFYRMLSKKVEEEEFLMDEKLRLAISYAATSKQAACLYLENPDIPIDNNAAERAIRPLAIGRKNFLFIGSPDAGETSAILYTLAQECRRCKVNAELWFAQTLQTIAAGFNGDYLSLLPTMNNAES